MDTLPPEERSERMGGVRNKDTKPKLEVRRLVHRMGYRYRLHGKDLPGHRILSDPVYTGTGYHNRYSFEVPRRPRTHGPRSGERTCRSPRPRKKWIPIPVNAHKIKVGVESVVG
jgi:hypothetical protein